MNSILAIRDFLSVLKAGMSRRSRSETTPARAAKVLSRQVDAAMAATPMIVGSNVLILLVLFITLAGSVSSVHLVAWAVAVFGTLILLMWIRLRYAAEAAGEPRRFHFWAWNIEIASILRALAFGAGIIAFFPGLSPAKQLVIGLTTAAMMGGGAFALGSLSVAAVLFVTLMGAAAIIALVLAGTHEMVMLAVLTAVYVLYLSVSIVNQGQIFFERALSEIVGREQEQTIGLLLKEFEDNSSDWLWRTDAHGFFIDVSDRFASVAGLAATAIEKLRFRDLFLAELGAFNREATRLHSRREAMRAIEVALDIRGKRRFWALTAGPSFDDAGKFMGFRGVASDVTELRAARERLENLAHFDQLTGLFNRASFLEALTGAIAERGPDSVGILLFDLTGFKLVNDTLGHGVGDTLLAHLGERMRKLRAVDRLFARLGGDEFALLINSRPDSAILGSSAETVLAQIAAPFAVGPHNVAIDASAGVALGGRDGTDAAELMRAADLALYAAKSVGRGQWLEFNQSLAAVYARRQNLEHGLHGAIDRNELSLRFQPIVSSRSGQVSAFEALLRWDSAEFGPVEPAEFVSIAEKSGMIVPIGNWVLHEATKASAICEYDTQICVNVSPVQLRNNDLVAAVKHSLAESGLPPERLVLEITEGVFLERNAQTDETLHGLLALGLQIALDDFGTGYSSLSYLRSFPFSKIKIDKMFVDHIAAGGPDALIFKAIVELANTLGFEVVAEGVENHTQFAEVVRLGCGHVQGYVISEPLQFEELPDFMRNLGQSLPASAPIGQVALTA